MKHELIKIDPEIMDLVHSTHFKENNPFTEEIFLVDIIVAGLNQEIPIQEYISQMSKGVELEMMRAEDELHPYHIWLSFQGSMIGEVPMENGIILARLMDAGKKLLCRVSKAVSYKSDYKGQHTRIIAKVYMVD